MAKPKPEKKPDAPKATQIRVLPMKLQLGDRLSDERCEWQVIGRPYTTAGGKFAHVYVESVKHPGLTEMQLGRARARRREAA